MEQREEHLPHEAGPEEDDRPPICPACGVTQGFVVEDERTRFVCLECGFSDGAAG